MIRSPNLDLENALQYFDFLLNPWSFPYKESKLYVLVFYYDIQNNLSFRSKKQCIVIHQYEQRLKNKMLEL